MDKREPNETAAATPSERMVSGGGADWRWSWLTRVAFLYAGVILPLICFLIGYPLGPEWQSGAFGAYAELLLMRRASIPWYPLLLYNVTCMTLMVADPVRFSRSFIVRFGIYSGVLVALQYWVLFGVAAGPGGNPAVSLLAWMPLSVVVVAFILGLGWLFLYAWQKSVPLAGWIVLPFFIFGIAFVHITIIGNLYFSTAFALTSYTAMAFLILRYQQAERFRFSLLQLLGVFLWAGSYFGAWRISFRTMLEEYAALPSTAPSGCYVSSAAARGHRWLVRAESHQTARGDVVRANDQMRYLKAAELALASASPLGHRACRWLYDRYGRALAAALVHPLLADLAYLLLKPAEWFARIGLALLLPGENERIMNLYRSAPCHGEEA
jgi:hypothetical protein